ncbi:hypothetical protein [Mesoplasma melaleucae]|uniref:Uncharacterized protein n=1 Tax=Mesoplasma melaleucae TaxID=81459 RepID=A0A2K8NWU8_9MOLU|nr:hypothetical protein [Mesoplasma melaleucae]ATZ18006.1 hypothetical protein EMELA_v1c04630 [Mesoplasma melaleucae]
MKIEITNFCFLIVLVIILSIIVFTPYGIKNYLTKRRTSKSFNQTTESFKELLDNNAELIKK